MPDDPDVPIPDESEDRSAAEEDTQPLVPPRDQDDLLDAALGALAQAQMQDPDAGTVWIPEYNATIPPRDGEAFAMDADGKRSPIIPARGPGDWVMKIDEFNFDPSQASPRWPKFDASVDPEFKGAFNPAQMAPYLAGLMGASPITHDDDGVIEDGHARYSATFQIQGDSVVASNPPPKGTTVQFIYEGVSNWEPPRVPLWKRMRERLLDALRIYFHANATDGDRGVPYWRCGRWWLTVNSPRTREQEIARNQRTRNGERVFSPTIHAEWSWFNSSFRAIGASYRAERYADSEHLFALHLYIGNVYLGLKGWDTPPFNWLLRAADAPPKRHGRSSTDREIGVMLTTDDGWFLSWHLWWPDNEWVKGDSKVRKGSVFLEDKLWGKANYVEHVDHESDQVMTLPEGDYPVHVKLFTSTWSRARDPFNWRTKTIKRATVSATAFAPSVPGKGENSWDCEDDATYSITTPAETVEEAIDAYRQSVLRTRERHGGKDWTPTRQFPVTSSER
jgi:hypothetical protein